MITSPNGPSYVLNRLLKYWGQTGRGEVFHAHVISYADNFIILLPDICQAAACAT